MSLLKHLITHGSAAAPAKQALLVTNEAILSADDTHLIGLLSDLGYGYTAVQDAVLSASDATGKDLVIASYGAAGSVGNTLQNIPEPLISCYSPITQNSEMAVSAGSGFSQVDFEIINNSHPITSSLSLGSLVIYNSSEQCQNADPLDLGAGATILAQRTGDPNEAYFYVYEAGSLLSDGSAAAGKRIATWIAADSLSKHTTAADDLLKKAFQWAAGEI